MSARYSPGSAYAFVGADTIVVVSTTTSAARDAIWSLVEDGAPIEMLAATLLMHAGAVADFVCIRRNQTRLTSLIRGSFRVQLGDGTELEGVGASTWREWSVTTTWPVEIITGTETAVESLPLTAGVVRAAQITLLETTDRPTPVAPRVEEPAAPPAPAAPAAVQPTPAREPEPERKPEPVPEPVQPEPRRKYDHHYEDSISAEELEAVVSAKPPTAEKRPVGAPRPSGSTFIDAVPDFSKNLPRAEDLPSAGPAVHRVRLPSGETMELDRPTIFGREPTSPPGRGQGAPSLVALPNPQRDISSSHVELRPEGEHLLAIDMSSYGTYLQLPDSEPIRLPAGKPFPLAPGARLHLNNTLAIDYEGMS